MKRFVSLLLILALLLTGCGGAGETAETAAVTEAAETAEDLTVQESPEIQLLLEQDWVPESIRQKLDETIHWNEMLEMLGNVIAQCDSSSLEQWNAIITPNNDPMERDDGMLAIYEAACALEIGRIAWNNWGEANHYYIVNMKYALGYAPRSSVFSNARDYSPYENFPGLLAYWDYPTSARFFSIAQSSIANPEPYFDHVDADTRFDDPLTRREAITATAKLIQAYEAMHSGGYTIPETDWDDPLLAEAAAAREAILNSPTTITKGEELVLGETYTGKAYYVSNSGSDSNDGLSPETAWATLNKVGKARLQYGDAVFFERGGSWYGQLKMQYGVTYSAYGEGAKPIITGSPLDASQEEKWTLYAETGDGGKIWQYAEKMPDAGVILLNGGEVVARKAYPDWNGKAYVNADAQPYVMENELEDLMFFSDLNLRGVNMMNIIEGDGRTGALYLRCDAGNPGTVFGSIEIAAISSATSTANKGWNAVDNLHFRCYSVSGMDCSNHSNIVYQNCEADWCGGAVKMYQNSWYNHEDIMVTISGGGMLLFGKELTARNNYIHDCENKGIAIVISGPGNNPAWLDRSDILAEGNVVERCGSSALLWVDNMSGNQNRKFEDIRFVGNFFVNGSYGWRNMNTRDLLDRRTQMIMFDNVLATGEVLFENNLFYRGAGTLIDCYGEDLQNGAVMPAMRGNTYVQDQGQLLFTKQDAAFGYYSDTTLANSDMVQMESCVREYMGDTTGTVIILEK